MTTTTTTRSTRPIAQQARAANQQSTAGASSTPLSNTASLNQAPTLTGRPTTGARCSNTASLNQAPTLTLTFFTNSKGAPVADLHLGERRLLATTHPATIIAAIFAMGLTELTVVTVEGSHTGQVSFSEPGADFWPIAALNLRMQMNPRLYQFRHLAPAQNYAPLLEGLDLFAQENWYDPTELADEHLRAAHHHLPKDLIKRPLVTPAPKGWKKTLARRNGWVYFPFC